MSTMSEPTAARARTARRVALPPAAPPPAPRRAVPWARLSWLAGVALLTVSLVAAGRVLHSSHPTDAPGQAGKPPAERSFGGPPGVVCLGTVDLENAPGGYVALAPVQAGEVIDVPAREGQAVKKGDVLLRVDDEAAAQTVAQAEIGMKLAQAQLSQAQQLTATYQAGVDAQQAAVDAGRHKIAAAEHHLHRLKYLKESVGQSNNDDIAAATEDLDAAKSALVAEEAKLRGMQANKPDGKIREAEENVALARQRVEQAKLARRKCALEAPADGLVLRVTVGRGSVLGPQTRQAPVLFAPAGPRVVRAEVEQEFAHRVQVGMAAVVQDEASGQATWTGKVKRLGAAYLPKRSAGGVDGLSLGGETARVMECVVELDPNQPLPVLGQKVRVNIGTHGGP